MTGFVCLSSSVTFVKSSLHQVMDRQKSRQLRHGALIVRVLLCSLYDCVRQKCQCHHMNGTLGRRMSQRPLARLQQWCQAGTCRKDVEKDANHRKKNHF